MNQSGTRAKGQDELLEAANASRQGKLEILSILSIAKYRQAACRTSYVHTWTEPNQALRLQVENTCPYKNIRATWACLHHLQIIWSIIFIDIVIRTRERAQPYFDVRNLSFLHGILFVRCIFRFIS